MPGPRKIIIVVVAVVAVVIGAALTMFLGRRWMVSSPSAQAPPRPPLKARLDTRGPYLILAERTAVHDYGRAIDAARKLHPEAMFEVFDREDVKTALDVLRKHEPRYAMVFIRPEHLDVNFAWQWLKITANIDDDPFVDVRTGFITGRSPTSVQNFVTRIQWAVDGVRRLPAQLVDNLGPNMTAEKSFFMRSPGSFFLPCYGGRFSLYTISHGPGGFDGNHQLSMENSGIVHFGGHGYPDRIVDGVRVETAVHLKLEPCVIFNGACYTGVTHRWFDIAGNRVREKSVASDRSFCLAVLDLETLAYLAATHPDHGIPVYQEMEYLAFSGAPFGDLIKHTHDGVILAAGGRMPDLPVLADGMNRPQWSPTDFMLIGTASRLLFGDPAMIVSEPFTSPPFTIEVKMLADNVLSVRAGLTNPVLKSTFTDTYHSDLTINKAPFNERARMEIELPPGFGSPKSVRVVKTEAGGSEPAGRLVGWALEKDAGRRILHVQVDFAAGGYMQSKFRQPGSVLELEVESNMP